MASIIKKGSVVKFTDRNGNKSGGTVIDLMEEGNVRMAYINCVDGSRIRKKVSDLIMIDRQKRGRVPSKFLEDFKKEILGNRIPDVENEIQDEILPNTPVEDTQENPCKQSNIDYLKKKIAELTAENNEKISEINRLKLEIAGKDSVIKEYNNRRLESKAEEVKQTTSDKAVFKPYNERYMDNMKISLTGMSNAIQAFAMDSKLEAVNYLVETILKLNNISND